MNIKVHWDTSMFLNHFLLTVFITIQLQITLFRYTPDIYAEFSNDDIWNIFDTWFRNKFIISVNKNHSKWYIITLVPMRKSLFRNVSKSLIMCYKAFILLQYISRFSNTVYRVRWSNSSAFRLYGLDESVFWFGLCLVC